jgi:hypothetical protein
MKKVHVAVAVAALSVVSSVCVGRAEAQATAEPFHAGEWGIETDVATNNGSVLRFFTPRTALILGATATHSNSSQQNGNNGEIKTTDNLLRFSLGVRHHTPIAPGISAITGVSAFIGSLQEHREFTGTPNQTDSFRSDYYGAFGEIGAQYMPTNHVAVGVAYRLNVQHDKVKSIEEKGTMFTASFMPVRVSLYF